jgi:hypothetical protein
MRSTGLYALLAGAAAAAPHARLDARAAAGLNAAAKAAGKLYFGTAVDNGDLNDNTYKSILANTNDFGCITPANSMKWCVFITPTTRWRSIDDTCVGTRSSQAVVNSHTAKAT